jgi:hypothetical protein
MQKNQDAAFFDMVHELVSNNHLMQEPTDASQKNRRRERRISFPFVQLLAPFDGVNLPMQDKFRHVQCHDISTRGFSYYDSPLPTYRFVAILFGKLPFRIFTAEVRHVQKASKPGIYLVGCRIVTRLSK